MIRDNELEGSSDAPEGIYLKPTPDAAVHIPLVLSPAPPRVDISQSIGVKPAPNLADELIITPALLPPPSPETRVPRTLLPGLPISYTSPLMPPMNPTWKNTLSSMWNFMSGTRLPNHTGDPNISPRLYVYLL